ncbi:MAG: hypothetical protein RIS47_1489 [Bacteroidota bacterium]
MIRSCSPTIFVRAATGYSLVVLAFGYEINWKPLYFKPITSDSCHRITPLWATAAIRARPIGSTICNAVGTLGKHFTLACGHVASTTDKPPACQNPRLAQQRRLPDVIIPTETRNLSCRKIRHCICLITQVFFFFVFQNSWSLSRNTTKKVFPSK